MFGKYTIQIKGFGELSGEVLDAQSIGIRVIREMERLGHEISEATIETDSGVVSLREDKPKVVAPKSTAPQPIIKADVSDSDEKKPFSVAELAKKAALKKSK